MSPPKNLKQTDDGIENVTSQDLSDVDLNAKREETDI